MSLSHDGNGTASVNTNSSSSTTFTLTSLSTSSLTVNLVVTVCNGALASCTRSPTSVSIPSGGFATITVNFTGGSAAGSGMITLAAKNTSGATLSSSSVSVTVAQPIPTVSTTPHLGDRRDVGLCVADCFESTLSYTLPAYTSLDVPRSATLLYRSGSAYPHGTLTLDVTDPYATATTFRLKIKDSNGAYVTFLNNSQELHFARNSAAGKPTRIVAQFSATAIPTSARLYTAEVAMFWGAAEQGTASATVRIIVLNEQNSPFGAGVSLIGVQRIWFNQPDGVLVTDGSGSAAFFAGTCNVNTTCAYASPTGEFSTLSTGGGFLYRDYPDGAHLTFYQGGHHRGTFDRFGNATLVDYGWNGSYSDYVPTAITDPAGASISFWYRDAGSTYGTWKEGSLGNIHSPMGDAPIGIDAANNAREWVELGGGTYRWRMAYLGQHLLDTAYDKANSAWKRTYRYGATLSHSNAPAVTLYNGTVASPRVTVRNAWAQLLDSAAAGKGTGTSNALAVPTAVRAFVVGPSNDTTYFSLNRFGSAQKTYAPLTQSDSVEYDQSTGQVTRTISPIGREMRYTWQANRLIKVQDVSASKLDSIEYASQYSLPRHIISGNGPEQWLTYDSLRTGWPLKYSRVGASNAIPTTYYSDGRGRDTAVVDPLGHRTTTYLATTGLLNRDSLRASNGQVTQFGRDGWGRVVSTRNAYGALTTTALDVLNRPAWVSGPLYNDTTRYQYDALNNVTSVTDAINQVYTYQRNALGWVIKFTNPSTLGDSTAYDVAGRPVYVRTRQGHQLAFEYDALGRLTKKIGITDHDTLTYAYDPNGQWKSVRAVSRDVLVSTDTTFIDVLGRTTMERTTRPGVASWRVESAYNDAPGRASMSVYKTGGSSAENVAWFNYDMSLRRLENIGILSGQTRFTYNNESLRDTVVFPSTLRETSEYTASHVLSKRYYSVAGVQAVLDRAYRTDSLSRLVERSTGTSGQFQQFDYDIDGRLSYWTKKTQNTTPSCVNLGGWGYDCSATSATTTQLISAQYDNVDNPSDLGATLDPGNRLKTFNAVTMTYGTDGGVQTKGPDTFDWDDFGQLKSITRSGTLWATFDYDGFGRRIRKWTATGGTTHYVWDGDQVSIETDGSGATTRAYTYYPGTDRLHSVTTGGQTYYASIEPATGDLNGLINASGNTVVAQYAYTPWGELEVDSTNIANSIRWKGLVYDRETGLYYVRARYYDPKIRRFVSEDPIGLKGGINMYSFADGDPINFSDPTGLWSWRSLVRPFVAFVTITAASVFTGGIALPAAMAGAAKALGAAALGSATAAGVETAFGGSFSSAFERNLNASSVILSVEALGAATLGGGVAAAGRNGYLQGYVSSKEVMPAFQRWAPFGGGLTLGPAAVFNGGTVGTVGVASLMAHEFGHTLQFVIGAAWRQVANPWVINVGFGVLGTTKLGGWWEEMASYMGKDYIK